MKWTSNFLLLANYSFSGSEIEIIKEGTGNSSNHYVYNNNDDEDNSQSRSTTTISISSRKQEEEELLLSPLIGISSIHQYVEWQTPKPQPLIYKSVLGRVDSATIERGHCSSFVVLPDEGSKSSQT